MRVGFDILEDGYGVVVVWLGLRWYYDGKRMRVYIWTDRRGAGFGTRKKRWPEKAGTSPELG